VDQPRLESASHWVDRLAFFPMRIELESRGIGPRTFVFAGMPRGAHYVIEAGPLTGAPLLTSEATSGGDGRLTINVHDRSIGRVKITARRTGS
jgi:hypothetical protein